MCTLGILQQLAVRSRTTARHDDRNFVILFDFMRGKAMFLR